MHLGSNCDSNNQSHHTAAMRTKITTAVQLKSTITRHTIVSHEAVPYQRICIWCYWTTLAGVPHEAVTWYNLVGHVNCEAKPATLFGPRILRTYSHRVARGSVLTLAGDERRELLVDNTLQYWHCHLFNWQRTLW